jgi:hypothetical protein
VRERDRNMHTKEEREKQNSRMKKQRNNIEKGK